jgi:hypothetical protein
MYFTPKKIYMIEKGHCSKVKHLTNNFAEIYKLTICYEDSNQGCTNSKKIT